MSATLEENTAKLFDEVTRLREQVNTLQTALEVCIEGEARVRFERDKLQAENASLRDRPAMREVIGELRTLQGLLASNFVGQAKIAVRDLLRRLDRESQETP